MTTARLAEPSNTPFVRVPVEVRDRLVDLFERYADTVDSGHFQDWADFFVDDCRYRVTSRENYREGLVHCTIYADGTAMLKDRADALRDSTVYEPRLLRHLIGRPKVTSVRDGVIRARTTFAVIESLSDAEPHIYMAGEYVDAIVEVDGEFRFQERWCVYDNYRIYNSLIHPV